MRGKPITQATISGEIISKYSSAAVAARETGSQVPEGVLQKKICVNVKYVIDNSTMEMNGLQCLWIKYGGIS